MTPLAGVLALSDGAWVAIGGVTTAFVTGAFALAGVAVSTARQKAPTLVARDPDLLHQCQSALEEMTADRNRWRDIAMSHIVGRRASDPHPSIDLDE